MRVIGLTVVVIGWLYLFGGRSGARQIVAASVIDRLIFVPAVLIPVAMAGVFPNDGVLQVWGMWTDPEHRGRGHARALLDALVGPAVAEGRPAALHVNVANSGARAFYESYGFVGTGELEPLRPGSEQRIELMRIN